jgi:hypothetical protein
MHTDKLALAFKSFDLDSLSKIYEQANWEARCCEIVQTLSSMSIFKRASRLQFDQDLLLDQQIRQILANNDPIVSDRNGFLLLHGQS